MGLEASYYIKCVLSKKLSLDFIQDNSQFERELRRKDYNTHKEDLKILFEKGEKFFPKDLDLFIKQNEDTIWP